MKLLVVTPYFYPKIGGLENYAWHICKGLKNKYGWEIVAVTSNHLEKKYVEETIEGIKIYRLPYWFKLSNTPINLGWIFDLMRIMRKEKPNVVNAHTPVPFIADLAAIASHLCSIPFVLTYHNDLIKNNALDLIFRLYFATLGKITFMISKNIIATSHFYVDNSRYLKSIKGKLSVISPGVNLDFYNSVEVSQPVVQAHNNKKVVLFVGQLDKTHSHKGLSYLIEAIKIVQQKIKQVKLVVIGRGDMIDSYREQSSDIDIEFKENANDTVLIQQYKLSDVVVLPSVSDSEGFGMVLIEAGACAKPVIGTKVGGIPYVIDHEVTGLLTDAKDASALARDISIILSNPKLAQQMGINGYKKIANKFTWDMKYKQAHNLFSNI